MKLDIVTHVYFSFFLFFMVSTLRRGSCECFYDNIALICPLRHVPRQRQRLTVRVLGLNGSKKILQLIAP